MGTVSSVSPVVAGVVEDDDAGGWSVGLGLLSVSMTFSFFGDVASFFIICVIQ